MTGADEVAVVATELDRRRAEFELHHDPRASFAYIYVALTRSLEVQLRRADTGFDDPEWVAHLATGLAHEYFTAMDALDQALGTARATARGVRRRERSAARCRNRGGTCRLRSAGGRTCSRTCCSR